MSAAVTPPRKGGVPPLVDAKSTAKPREKKTASKKNDHLPSKSKSSDKANFASELLSLRELRITKRKAHRKALRQGLARACEIGFELCNSSEAWAAFIAADWGKLKIPTKDHRKDAVRWAIKFWMGEGKANQKKASFYYNAVASLIASGANADKIKKQLKRHGLKRLQREGASAKKGAASSQPAEVAPLSGEISLNFHALFKDAPTKLLRAPAGATVTLTGVLSGMVPMPEFRIVDWDVN